jgi:hypothetical protein
VLVKTDHGRFDFEFGSPGGQHPRELGTVSDSTAPRKHSTQEKVTMSKFRILGVAALALLTLARDSTAQRGGAVRAGARSGGRRTPGRGVRSGNWRQDWRRHWRGPISWSGGAGARPVPSDCGVPERSALGFQSSTPGGSGSPKRKGNASHRQPRRGRQMT